MDRSMASPWSDLPDHILGLFVDRLASSPVVAAAAAVPELQAEDEDDTARFRAAYRSHHTDAAADLARFRAVSRSCLAAVREQLPRPPRRLPWTVLIDGSFITALTVSSAAADDDDTQPEKHHHRRFPSWPEKTTCIGATNEWLAIECVYDDDVRCPQNKRSSYHLHNPFSGETVPLPEIDAVIEADSKQLNLVSKKTKLFKIRKVLMRSSSPGDVVAVLTNNYDYPIILVRPGKGAWSPRPRSAPFIYIVDIVFLGDTLYGITKAEDLISLDLAFDADDGKPTVARTRRVIRHEPKADDLSVVWGNADFKRVPTNLSPLDNAYDLWSDVDEKYRQHEDEDDVEAKNEIMRPEDDYDRIIRYNIMSYTGDDTITEAIGYDDEIDNGPIITTWHILESLGRLLMVRREVQWISGGMNHTHSAHVFEANINAGAWMRVTAGLDGHSLFISRFNCKSIPAFGEVEKDAVYFIDTGDVLNMNSQVVISQPQRDLRHDSPTWIFPPEIVI